MHSAEASPAQAGPGPERLLYESPHDRAVRPGRLLALGILAFCIGVLMAVGNLVACFVTVDAIRQVRAATFPNGLVLDTGPAPTLPANHQPFNAETSDREVLAAKVRDLVSREDGRVTSMQAGSLMEVLKERFPADRSPLGAGSPGFSYAIMLGGDTLEVKVESTDREAIWILPDGRAFHGLDKRRLDPFNDGFAYGLARLDRELKQGLQPLFPFIVAETAFQVMAAGVGVAMALFGLGLIRPMCLPVTLSRLRGTLLIYAALCVVTIFVAVWSIAVWPEAELALLLGAAPASSLGCSIAVRVLIAGAIFALLWTLSSGVEVENWRARRLGERRSAGASK